MNTYQIYICANTINVDSFLAEIFVCVCVCVCVRVCDKNVPVFVHNKVMHSNAYMDTQIHIYIPYNTNIREYTCTYVPTLSHTNTHKSTRIRTCIHILYIYIYMCIYIYL